ncbi:MAG: hypothetical protein A2687_01615 [Candidatus Levybacteria bacterium RIFCSPHIGHO2_01_FULL_38_26]|nr:MAG: hypothetical protein A2687_01615 [Candidatus Levybacteria bacterium RIFCSPHIGHO2_01_FULL_38_26]
MLFVALVFLDNKRKQNMSNGSRKKINDSSQQRHASVNARVLWRKKMLNNHNICSDKQRHA